MMHNKTIVDSIGINHKHLFLLYWWSIGFVDLIWPISHVWSLSQDNRDMCLLQVYSFNRVAQVWYWDDSKKAKENPRTHMFLLVSFIAVPLAEANYTAKPSIRRTLLKGDGQHGGHECSRPTLDKANVQDASMDGLKY